MAKQDTDEVRRAIICSLLRQVRTEAGLTQVQLAERLGQAQSVVSKLESGERRLELGELIAICSICGLSLVEFARRLQEALKET